MINLVLCGGSGSRLWPLSRTLMPKQFVRMFGDQSLFQQTIIRNQPLCEQTLIVSNQNQYFLALEQIQEMDYLSSHFLLEPVGRNTAPAIALACLSLTLLQMKADEFVLVTPADHLIQNLDAYAEAVDRAKRLASEDKLVTFGIKPSHAETGYGYIQANAEEVISFTEKPNLELAKSYLKQGNYYWNSGIFCFKAAVFLEELKRHSQAIFNACEEAMSTVKNSPLKDTVAVFTEGQRSIRIDKAAMMAIPDNSIDYAVMEHSQRVAVVPALIKWSDLGSFDSLATVMNQKDSVNTLICQSEDDPQPICIDAYDNLLVSEKRQIALIDVHDLIVVDSADSLLISQKGSSQKVKQVVAEITKKQPELAEIHRIAHRPWGTYEVLVEQSGYKVKRITVKPGGQLSLQKHFHRNEHWIVVSGTATVTVEDETKLVRPNESTYIKMGQIHRLQNHGKINLVMIEVQVGEYTGEDDITRIDDIYSRDET